MSEIRKQSTGIQESLAYEINLYHGKCEETLGQAVVYAKEAGDRLAKVKAGLGHGEWLPWLEKNFKGTPRTAQVYMRIASNWSELAKYETASHSSIRGGLKELAEPREVVHRTETEGAVITTTELPDGTHEVTIQRTVKPPPPGPLVTPSYEDRLYEEFEDKVQFVARKLYEVVELTTARFEDIPQENPLPFLEAFEWRQVLAKIEKWRDGKAARWVEDYAKAGKGTSFDMRQELDYVLTYNEYADIRRIEEDAKILREAGRSYAALAQALEAGLKERDSE
jgi:hypothetical protein